jgi:NAD(P)-dependent dehydrogenase (short-subunit alcohol dehydrogenase family)
MDVDREQSPMRRRVEGKVALVTGAGSRGQGVGTGKAISVTLAREGAKVLLVDLYPDRVAETLQMIKEDGGEGEVFIGDATNESECAAMIKAAVDRFGSLDIIVNNLGICELKPVVGGSLEDWERTLRTNLTTVFLTSKFGIPAMINGGGGAIVNVSSVNAIQGFGSDTAAYSASKGGMNALTVDLAFRHGLDGIRVNGVAPGFIVTPMHDATAPTNPQLPANYLSERHRATALGFEGDAWDIAHAAVFLASEEARFITGVTLYVDGGAHAAAPTWMTTQAAARA